ncbi:transposase [Alicyclobacillus cycloheptanicus]|uniref:Transposase n=1 Tax=Alicyclobacillus cycloheptanicus TaxID=1457 RepID=A0ABT9XMM1_9BACL|nr:transposase [Alicyclobacillus cycloheptanicus]
MARNVDARIQRITEGTLIVGIDIAKHTHVARSVDWRGIELGKPLTFENTRNGLEGLERTSRRARSLMTTRQRRTT